jgi:ribonucleotide reductase beta subunit family protein with ferritin-like domain
MDLSKDVLDWNNHLNDNERHFISHVRSLRRHRQRELQ